MKASFLAFLLLAVASADAKGGGGSAQCRDDDGNPVDWFIAYKLPMDTAASDPQFRSGSAYFYMTPSVPSWKRSPKAVNDVNSIAGLTLQPIYAPTAPDDLAYVLYNDQAPPPAPAVFRDGHTKGVIVVGPAQGTGFWLLHSVPHFPKLIPGNQSEFYPPGGLENGQIFFCLSLAAADIDGVIGGALLYTKSNIYEAHVPDTLRSTLPKLVDVVYHNATRKQAPWYALRQLQTLGKPSALQVMVFAKGVKFRKDIYSAWIAPKLSTGLNVQSWLQGSHPLASDCRGQFAVYNVEGKELGNEHFNVTNDHSKWANGIEKPWTCIADLNRAKPQKTRGGVALCVSDPRIWSAFKSAILVTQPCATSHDRRG